MAKLIQQRSDSVDIRGLLDIDTPTGEILSGIYKRSFAYSTIKDRLPIILTKVIDTLSRDKDEIAAKYGNEAKEDVKHIIGFVSKLKSEMMTNKPLQELKPLSGNVSDDVNKWNEVLAERTKQEGEPATWFKTLWLFSECYMYRRLYHELTSTRCLKTYDPFEKQKCDVFKSSFTSIKLIAKYITNNIFKRLDNVSSDDIKCEFVKLVKLSLWGNKCDLSLSGGSEVSNSGNSLDVLESFEQDLLVDNTNIVWENIKNHVSKVDIVLDNAGYELFTDLCLAILLTSFDLVDQVRFYVKRMPWYVSDVTSSDFYWLIETLSKSDDEHLSTLGNTCKSNLKNSIWTIEVESFWTEPYDFAEMKSKDPTLYKKLGEAKLIIFKGDLNYRKLLGDINWEHTTSLLQALRGFHPTNIVSLRTLKCDIVVGLSPGQAMKIQEDDPNWMISGRYGIIQAA